ncbi:hypothetical protein J3Q64DRAFT_1748878 [Phycomyces blakesleeanus]|uniref:Transmembrane protein n=1 Tax=Phycomyces blakesleeanus TaxID=4837 RepID=A0ABR3AVV1_PHYBL
MQILCSKDVLDPDKSFVGFQLAFALCEWFEILDVLDVLVVYVVVAVVVIVIVIVVLGIQECYLLILSWLWTRLVMSGV